MGLARARNYFMGDIPFWSFDPQIFHVGTPYSDLVPPSNFSIPIRVILGWDIPFWSFFLDIYSIVAPVMELFHYGPHQCRLSVVAGVLGRTHCESVWSRFGMVMLRPFYVRY